MFHISKGMPDFLELVTLWSAARQEIGGPKSTWSTIISSKAPRLEILGFCCTDFDCFFTSAEVPYLTPHYQNVGQFL